MAKVVHLSIARKSTPAIMDVVQCATAPEIQFILDDYMPPEGSSARIYIKKSETEVYNDCSIDGNIVTYKPTTHSFDEAGNCVAQLQITETEDVAVSYRIFTKVEPNLIDEESIEAQSEYSALSGAIQSINRLSADVNRVEAVTTARIDNLMQAGTETKSVTRTVASSKYETETLRWGSSSKTVYKFSDTFSMSIDGETLTDYEVVEVAYTLTKDGTTTQKITGLEYEVASNGQITVTAHDVMASSEDPSTYTATLYVTVAVPGISIDEDAELLDVRVGYDGTVYQTAGTAVRSQVTTLVKESTEINNYYGDIITSKNLLDNRMWINGAYIDSVTGGIITNASFSYQFVRLPKPGTYTTYRASVFGTSRYKLSLYDAQKNYVKTVDAPSYDSSNPSWVHFSVTDEDFDKGVRYVGISTNTGVDLIVAYGTESVRASQYPVPIWTIDHAITADYAEKMITMRGKTIACDGDSICAGTSDSPDNLGGWCGRLIENNSMNGHNYGVNGGTITAGLTFESGNPRHCVAENIDNIYAAYPNLDYLILEGGVNDADVIGRITEGTIPEKFGSFNLSNFSGNYDKNTFCGAVELLFYKAVTLFAGKKIGFIIPPQMGTSFSTQTNRRAYFNTIIEIAEKWHIPVLDLWNTSTMDNRLTVYYDSSLTPSQNISQGKYYADGQHPTSKGYNAIQNKIQAWCNTL